MKTDNAAKLRSDRVWLSAQECHIEDFAALVERRTDPADYPFAAEVISNVLVYDGAAVREAAASPDTRKALLAEWVEAMTDGPGVVVFRGAFPDTAPIDEATAHFWALIEEERASHTGGGDHFRATVIAPSFADLSRIEQHRAVYAVFGADIGGPIHALSLETRAE